MVEILEEFAAWIALSVLGLEEGSHAAEAMIFFVADTIQIFVMLVVLIYAIAMFRSFFSVEKTRGYLENKPMGLGNLGASILGTVTPFCTCSSVPLFIGFVEAGIPLGVTFSFLITSPLVNEIAVALLWSTFGFKITAIYVISGIVIGVVAGLILGRMGLEKYVEEYVYQFEGKVGTMTEQETTFKERADFATRETSRIVKTVAPWVVLGVGVGAIIHGYVPKGFLEDYLVQAGVFGVPMAVIIGVPLYSNAAGLIPITQALVEKGVPMGVALAFMMATAALSFPEAVILRKVLKLRLVIIFFATTALGIIFTGYLFNMIL